MSVRAWGWADGWEDGRVILSVGVCIRISPLCGLTQHSPAGSVMSGLLRTVYVRATFCIYEYVHAAVYKSASAWQIKCTEMLISDRRTAFWTAKCLVQQSGKLKNKGRRKHIPHVFYMNERLSDLCVCVRERNMIQTNPVILGNAGESLFWCHGNSFLRFNTHSCGAPPPLRTAEAVSVLG